jgi:hypothetical protein
MSLNMFLAGIAEEFSGKTFTVDDLVKFVNNDDYQPSNSCVDGAKKAKKGKKAKGPPKKIKMTIRQYIMTQETDVYKAKVIARVEQNKKHNQEHQSEIEDGEEELPENFLKVLKVIMQEMTDDEKEEIQAKADKYNEENCSDSESE